MEKDGEGGSQRQYTLANQGQDQIANPGINCWRKLCATIARKGQVCEVERSSTWQWRCHSASMYRDKGWFFLPVITYCDLLLLTTAACCLLCPADRDSGVVLRSIISDDWPSHSYLSYSVCCVPKITSDSRGACLLRVGGLDQKHSSEHLHCSHYCNQDPNLHLTDETSLCSKAMCA